MRDFSPTRSTAAPEVFHVASKRRVAPQPIAAPQIADADQAKPQGRASLVRPIVDRRRKKKSSRAWLASLGVHALVLLLLAPMTYVIVTNEQLPLFASMFDVEGPEADEPGAAPIELVSFEEFEMPNAAEEAAPDLAEGIETSIVPAEADLGGEVATNFGQLNTLPTDVGTLMAGGGRGETRARAAVEAGAGPPATKRGLAGRTSSARRPERIAWCSSSTIRRA